MICIKKMMIRFLFIIFFYAKLIKMAAMMKSNFDYQNYFNPKDFYEVEIP